MTQVICQRMFTQGPASHYIQVQRPQANDSPKPTPPPDTAGRLVQQVEWAFHDQQSQETTIQAGELDAANPWLRRARRARGPEQGARAIWDATQELGRASLRTTGQVGHLNRVEAHRTGPQNMPH
ncbi:hypothetical protein PHISP_05403 [Aspergillus sp. HF37]|nr:hypothetical protein PHISP_05403 [Aspergillus sp. HF37]